MAGQKNGDFVPNDPILVGHPAREVIYQLIHVGIYITNPKTKIYMVQFLNRQRGEGSSCSAWITILMSYTGYRSLQG